MGLVVSSIVKKIFTKSESRMLLVGLDNAGKTTLLYQMILGKMVTTIPSMHLSPPTINYNKHSFTIWDVPGHPRPRDLWFHYYENTDGVIFVVDSSDKERLEEAKEVLHSMVQDQRLNDTPLLVFSNKIDLPATLPVSEVEKCLNLHKIIGRKWTVEETSALTGIGIRSGFKWLSDNIIDR